MKIVFASDSFKGSLTSGQIVEILKEVTKDVFPTAETTGLLVADGGEGTMKAVVTQLQGDYETVLVKGPLFETVEATYGILPGNTAIIEMAEASGLPMVPEHERNPIKTTSYGTGMLIRDALEKGIRNIVIAIGGSATNDGGMGAMTALGVQFLDQDGKVLEGKGGDLVFAKSVDCSKIHPAIADTNFTVMCDVKNPLLGETGATYTFGKQKGGTPEILHELEKGMEQYASLVEKTLHTKAADMPGAGAAGGLGFALMAFLNAKLQSGIETVLDLIQFDNHVKDADFVITGEGRMDWQSAFGKVPAGVGERCKKANIPAVAIVGGLLEGYENIYEHGINSIVTTVNGIMELSEAIEKSEYLYRDAAYRLLSAIKCGIKINYEECGGRFDVDF